MSVSNEEERKKSFNNKISFDKLIKNDDDYQTNENNNLKLNKEIPVNQ